MGSTVRGRLPDRTPLCGPAAGGAPDDAPSGAGGLDAAAGDGGSYASAAGSTPRGTSAAGSSRAGDRPSAPSIGPLAGVFGRSAAIAPSENEASTRTSP